MIVSRFHRLVSPPVNFMPLGMSEMRNSSPSCQPFDLIIDFGIINQQLPLDSFCCNLAIFLAISQAVYIAKLLAGQSRVKAFNVSLLWTFGINYKPTVRRSHQGWYVCIPAFLAEPVIRSTFRNCCYVF